MNINEMLEMLQEVSDINESLQYNLNETLQILQRLQWVLDLDETLQYHFNEVLRKKEALEKVLAKDKKDAVVQCKDCKYYNSRSEGFGWCENMDRGTTDDFYCANGTKIENEESVAE
jgi:hypothetical protein